MADAALTDAEDAEVRSPKGAGKRAILAEYVKHTGRAPSWKAARKWAKRAAQAERRAAA